MEQEDCLRVRFSKGIAMKAILLLTALTFLFVLIVLPLFSVFMEALAQGWHRYLEEITDDDAISAIKLTLFVALIAVPLNLLFGISAAWSITRFEFFGKRLLITLIDLPFSISPVIVGLIYTLLFSRHMLFGQWLILHHIHILFAFPAIVIVTIFVTFPFIARELIPLMHEQGSEEEQAAILLGATGWQTFWKITLPNIKWGLLYGVLLCNARAMGEFGAVSIVSAHIAGRTNTIPLQVETLYDGFDTVGAFAVASILTVLAVVTLVAKTFIELRFSRRDIL